MVWCHTRTFLYNYLWHVVCISPILHTLPLLSLPLTLIVPLNTPLLTLCHISMHDLMDLYKNLGPKEFTISITFYVFILWEGHTCHGIWEVVRVQLPGVCSLLLLCESGGIELRPSSLVADYFTHEATSLFPKLFFKWATTSYVKIPRQSINTQESLNIISYHRNLCTSRKWWH